ncbi:MAG: IS701 family transposase, partial [Gemmatimonadales bacterium]
MAVERANVLVRAVLAGLLQRKRSIAAALMYILALGRDVRANCWDLSEKAGLEPGDDTFHRLLGRYRWSWECGREMLPGLAQQALSAGPDADDEIGPGLAVDETTDLKRGTATACVSPQHSGVTGKTENCVTWVFSALVTATGQCWAWFDLYMPECWATDPARRKKAGIPRGLAFATKPELAITQVKAVIGHGVRICWVAADEVYGRSGAFRDACRKALLSYVVIIPCDYRVTLAKGTAPARAENAARDAVFERRSAGNGTKGPRWGWWALLATEDPEEFLLVRKLDREKNPYTYYLCHATPGRPATLKYFVTIASRRWPVETSFKSGKDGFGWDQSQV